MKNDKTANIIEHDPRPELSHMEDNEPIQQSENQINPYLARPEDFVVLQPGEAEVPSHNQQGRTAAERRKLLKQVDEHGKSPFKAPLI
jgi:hypothetical protein